VVHHRARWCPGAVVHHRVESSESRLADWANWLRYTRRCESAPLVVKRNPGWRVHLFARLFYKPYHAYVVAALGGLGLARRRPALAALMLTPWVVHRTFVEPRPARRRWLVAVLAMGFVVDAAEVVATIRGAVRYRTLLL